MSTNPEFDNCKFFDCGDPEVLSHTDVHGALEDHFERNWETEETLEQQAERLGPVTVNGFMPKIMGKEWLESHAQGFVETFEESFYEEFGGEDPEDAPPWKPEDRVRIERAFLTLLTSATKDATIWQCDESASREFSPEECLKILK